MPVSISDMKALNNENTFEKYKIEDLSKETFNMYIRRIKSKYELWDKKFDIRELCEQEGLLIKNELTKSAIFLFGGDCANKYSTSILKITKNKLIFSKIVHGNLFVQFEEIMRILQENLDFIHPEDYLSDMEYPIKAVKEAVINMLVHADYQNYKNNIIIIYNDSIEFKNNIPLNKFHDNKVDENIIYEGNILKDNNKKIKSIFKKSGINFYRNNSAFKMKKELERRGMKKPDFYIEDGFFTVKFYKKDFFYISEFK